MTTWDEDYPYGYECCASGACEVCGGAQGIARAAAAGGDDVSLNVEEGHL